ncbi:MAG: DUF1127 domain-containing protein [Gammaproteobacteria bacterium]|nr:DUF1127 domain-containing protein [Gammaproteobacteria bacterium]
MKQRSWLTMDMTDGLRIPGYRLAMDLLDELWVLWHRLDFLYQRQCTRLKLGELSDERLKDLGISRWECKREARKWFWQD